MSYSWFKFYGKDFLSDAKMLSLSAEERSCWLTLLCYASVASESGVIKHLSEEQIMQQSGISTKYDQWENTVGVLNKFKNLGMITLDNGMITVLNWGKRQEVQLTPYERLKRHRKKKRNDTKKITVEEEEEEEEVEEEKSKNTPAKQSKSFFSGGEEYSVVRGELVQKIPEKLVDTELEKFVLYWTEPNKSGTKVRWQQQSTFDVRRRLLTWFGRIKDQQSVKINRGRGIAE